MCITKTEAWAFGGQSFPTESRAINAAIGKYIDNPAGAQKVMDSASLLIPLLQRIVEIEAAKKAAEDSTEDDDNSYSGQSITGSPRLEM